MSSSFGSWASPISAELIAASAVRLGGLALNDNHTRAYWTEGRASEGGRSAVVSADPSMPPCLESVRDAVPPSINSRTRVHEYGGGSFCAIGDKGDVITTDYATQHLRLVRGGQEGKVDDLVINDVPARYRYADFVIDPKDRSGDRLLFAVREDHTIDKPSAVVNTIVCFPVVTRNGLPTFTTPDSQTVLQNGAADPNVMMSNPRLDPTGQYLAWIQWSHPNMPWDDTQLFVGKLSGDGLSFEADPMCVAGGIGESVLQPLWERGASVSNEDRLLFFISDRSDGWWNIHRSTVGRDGVGPIECVLRCAGCEFGRPTWQFGFQNYDFLPSGDMVTFWSDANGAACVIRLDSRQKFCISKNDCAAYVNASHADGAIYVAALPRSDVTNISDIVADVNGNIFLLGGGITIAASIFKWESIADHGAPFDRNGAVGEFITLRKSICLDVNPAYMSVPELKEFPTVCDGSQCSSFGWFYRPTNPTFDSRLDGDTLPPLLVKLHGGPTGRASTIFRLDIQYFTSRGFAVLDVDYGGSSGYGRGYRNRLQRNWGVVDVEDCCRGAAYLAEIGLVDPKRLAIQGGSAGGYTALASVAFRDCFHAATSSYGIGDLEALLKETHKFESRYTDGLIGPYPESKAVYESRCPVRYVDNIKCPILFLHGKEDPVCPPNQATDMYAQLLSKGVPSCLILFDGESHGWRKAETICAALTAEINFYGRVFGFTPDAYCDLDIVGM